MKMLSRFSQDFLKIFCMIVPGRSSNVPARTHASWLRGWWAAWDAGRHRQPARSCAQEVQGDDLRLWGLYA